MGEEGSPEPARNRPGAMSALEPLSGGKRTLCGHVATAVLDPPRRSRPAANTGTDDRENVSDHTLWSPTKLMYVRRPFGPNAEPHAFKSVIRMIATTRPSFAECSIVSLLQVQTKFFLAVKVLPSCTTRSSPSVI